MTTKDGDWLPIRLCDRAFAVEDLHVRSDGSGRVVEAYAAVFNTPTEILDQDGHYDEQLSAGAFAKTLQEKNPRDFRVLFNHGRTIDGTPNALATLPIGVPEQVTADERGIYTVTRYLENPLAEDVLNAIKAGAIKAQSFSGRFLKSARSWPGGRRARALITRNEIEMREYGPAVFAAYPTAAILGTRAEQLVSALITLPPDRRQELLQQFEGFTTPPEPETPDHGTPPGAAAVTDEPRSHSARSSLRQHIRAARIARHME